MSEEHQNVLPLQERDWCYCGGQIASSGVGETCLNQQIEATLLGFLGFLLPFVRPFAGWSHARENKRRILFREITPEPFPRY